MHLAHEARLVLEQLVRRATPFASLPRSILDAHDRRSIVRAMNMSRATKLRSVLTLGGFRTRDPRLQRARRHIDAESRQLFKGKPIIGISCT